MTFPFPFFHPYAAVSAPTLILDTLSTWTLMAVSTYRRLTGTYSGPLIRVRRSSDNAEQDIGYGVDNLLDTTALTTFVGANDGFLVTVYDQSGNGADAGQSTAASQPKIVSAGTIVTNINSKPCADLDGSNDFLVTAVDMDTVIDRTNWCAFAITRFETGNGGFFTTPGDCSAIAGGYNPPTGGYWVFAGQHNAFSENYSYDGSNDTSSPNVGNVYPRSVLVWAFWRDSGAGQMSGWMDTGYFAGSPTTTGVRTASAGTKLGIGAHTGAPNAYLDGQFMELISFTSLPSLADRNTLGADQAAVAGRAWTTIT